MNATIAHCAELAVLCWLIAAPAYAQAPQVPERPTPQTRAEQIAAERADKVAVLWPERQNAMVDIVNGVAERGLKEGLDSGLGANGLQFVLGGMRPAQGLSAGVGYRRSDLFRDRLGYRGTARGTVHGAYMLDFELDFSQVRTHRASVRWYTKFEHSPEIDYFGQGNNSSKDHRSSYVYNDFSSDINGSFEPVRFLHLGLTGGYFQHQREPAADGHACTAQGEFRDPDNFQQGEQGDPAGVENLRDDRRRQRFQLVHHRSARSALERQQVEQRTRQREGIGLRGGAHGRVGQLSAV